MRKRTWLAAALSVTLLLSQGLSFMSFADQEPAVEQGALPGQESPSEQETSGTPEASVSETGTELTIRMVGDDLIHKIIYVTYGQPDGTYNFDPLFQNVKEDIQSADIAIINQETIMVKDPSQYGDYPAFGTPEAIGHSIVSAGFDVVAHANNHTMDRGLSGILNTVNFWKTNYPEIQYLGIHDSPADSDIRYLTRKGITVGFVNYTYGLNGFSRPQGGSWCVDLLTDGGIEATMAEARAGSDLLIAVLHVGEEYRYTPTAYARQQVARFIDLGADVVICSHPHVIEPFGMVTTAQGRTGLAYYSLGNFVSGQSEVPRVLGGMADFTVKKTGEGENASVEIVRYDMVPLVSHMQGPYVTAYRLDQYPDELALRHNSVGKGFSKDALWNLYYSILNGTAGA